MRHFSPGELTQLRATQDGAMMDICELWQPVTTADSFGQPLAGSYNKTTGVACGFAPGGRERVLPDKTVIASTPTLRLPIDTTIDDHWLVRLTHRHGEALDTPLDFEVAGPVKRGPSGLVVALRAVEV